MYTFKIVAHKFYVQIKRVQFIFTEHLGVVSGRGYNFSVTAAFI